jgi:hypothetical protein
MAGTVRKNLMVDAGAIAELARRRGMSESEAVRDAVAQALAWEGMADALEELGRLGAFADPERIEAMYGPLPGSIEQPETTKPNRGRSRERFRIDRRGVVGHEPSLAAEVRPPRRSRRVAPEPDGAPASR